jgi:predicted amidophosphoribosyltransferase
MGRIMRSFESSIRVLEDPMGMVRDLLDALFPCACLLCGALADDPLFPSLCRDCATGLPRSAWPLATPLPFVRSAWSCAPYQGAGGRLVRIGKYARDESLLADLSRHAARLAAGRLPDVDVVVPVPTTRRHALERGFSPPWMMADALSSTLGIPRTACLARRGGLSQAGLDHARRQRQAESAFEVRRELAAEPRVLLLDDVVTSGATASACARALLAGGARCVHFFAFTSALP